MRILILQADSVVEPLRARHGDYPDMFARLLDDAGRSVLTTLDARDGEFPSAAGVDACLITGSRHSVYDPLPWIAGLAGFAGRVLDAGGRVAGICFGHQLLAHFFGGRTERVGWSVGRQTARVVAREPWMTPYRDRFDLLSSHQDQVVELPAGARRFAESDHCPNAGFVCGDQVLTFQGHPEFTPEYAADLLHRREDLLDPVQFACGLRSLDTPADAGLVAGWILNFLAASPGGAR